MARNLKRLTGGASKKQALADWREVVRLALVAGLSEETIQMFLPAEGASHKAIDQSTLKLIERLSEVTGKSADVFRSYLGWSVKEGDR